MQKFPEDDLAKRRKALMSSETVLDYKAKKDEARRVELARPPDVVEAERMAELYEQLKETTKKYFDMGGRLPRTMAMMPGKQEYVYRHYLRGPSGRGLFGDLGIGCRVPEGHCPICETEKRKANIQEIPRSPKFIAGVDFAKKPAVEVVSIDHDSMELRIAAELVKVRDSKGKNDMLDAMIYAYQAATGKTFTQHNLEKSREREDREFVAFIDGLGLDMPGKSYAALAEDIRRAARNDPLYEIDGTRRETAMTDAFRRLFLLGRRVDPPTYMVTTTNPNRTKAEVWKYLKDFLESEIATLPSDIKIEPVAHRSPEYGISPTWDDAAKVLDKTMPPGRFYNEVLGEYFEPYKHERQQIKGVSADAVFIDELAKIKPYPKLAAVGTDIIKDRLDDAVRTELEFFKQRAYEALRVPEKFIKQDDLAPSDSKTFAARMHLEGRISDTTLLGEFGIKKEEEDESRGAEEVQHADGVERSQQGNEDPEAAVECAEPVEHAE